MWRICQGGAASCDESDPEYGRVSEAVKPAGAGSSLVDALLLVPSSVGDTTSSSRPHTHSHRRLHVPYVVSVCCQHLQTYGQCRSLHFRCKSVSVQSTSWVFSPVSSHIQHTIPAQSPHFMHDSSRSNVVDRIKIFVNYGRSGPRF